ncbi:VRR-NUC domain-containing protein [Bordetella hinzii]|uniref:VRR-NUC domain-containing protein n=1 Tax=Bordetella hinzii TaxID=103855 RepID=UPI000417FB90|nr:VRR-NUC domain-containing protein [Bordetella hinzii]AKQ55863.1 VRR-NUC domain protein [Bordetella hinzii]KCB28029.1 VRR-NUC domain protein [Bordetella hinzii CA90 BAL1384]KCB28299.1 VRR-NUC domain protein [Bordetella hinzii L60]KCB52465.1 VRR-NUC domain protein [Bordetella hinzii 1277]KXA71477.1 nuclease [Bordetella hinzii LMG 13501]
MLPAHRYYYLHNFQRALAWVAQRYDDLLDAEERGFLARFPDLPQASQALLVRLLARKGGLFRAGKLAYDEIGDIAAAAGPLLALGWLSANPELSVQDLGRLYTKAELARLAGLPPALRKDALLQALAAAGPRPHRDWWPDAAEAVWQVRVDAVCQRLRLMFFGNLRQQWDELVLADLGIFQYESVDFSRDSRAFRHRADVEDYLRLHGWREQLDEAGPDAALREAVRAADSANPWLMARRAKLLMRIGQACERLRDWPGAEAAYRVCDYRGARHRLMRVLEQQGRHEEAYALALQAAGQPEDEGESQRLARMLPRLRRQLGLDAPRRPPEPGLVSEYLRLAPPAEARPVEFVVRDYYGSQDGPVHYVESGLVNALFGLLCWDAIFAPLPGAFFHPFQRGPADLDAPDFVARRAALFQACLARLDDGSYRAVIRERYAAKQGLQSPFVYWGMLGPELLEQALDCLPAADLRRLFERLLADLRAHRSGLPDLIRFWPAQGRYEFIEVKGPGDRLQDNQIAWLRYCARHGIAARVCYVSWACD